MRIVLAQINPTVGDIDGNARLIERAIDRAGNHDAALVVFPELAVVGYPPRDLLLKPSVVGECVEAVQALAARCQGIAAVIGYPCPTSQPKGLALHNSAALCADGRIVHRHDKHLLPTYDVFDEHRYFEPGPAVDVASLNGCRLGVSICEDLWNDPRIFSHQLYHGNPIDDLAAAGAQLLINCAASPFAVGKHLFRSRLMINAAQKHRIPLVYCNQVGGNDELIFEGYSCAYDAAGNLLARARGFVEDLLLVDVPVPTESAEPVQAARRTVIAAADAAPDEAARLATINRIEPALDGVAAAYHGLVLGLRDYCRKCRFESIVIGLSGGIDSAVCAAICVSALGSDHVRGIAMPSRYSSKGSVSDAEALAQNLGIAFDVLPIEQPHTAFETLLEPYFEGLPPDAAEENIQARVRGVILMAFSNKFRSLLVTTGNKSEVAVGYCTLYGDMAGGLAVLSDVPKTMVYELARWINENPRQCGFSRSAAPVIPEDTITKPPSAELRPDQKDQDSLPEYEVLDEIIERYVEQEQSARRIIDEAGFDPELVLRVIRLIDLNEYKRKQMAPGLKITGRAFGVGRRMPIAQGYDARRTIEWGVVHK